MFMSAKKLEIDLMLKVLDSIKILKNGQFLITFLEGTKVECKYEKYL